jgi:L-glutamine-phosphate cytidylyltransferase
MRYIILAAGKGTRLHPLTKTCPKCMYTLGADKSVIQSMIANIRHCDQDAEFIVVTGFMREEIEKHIKDVVFVYNPFYEVTNSIASLWFAKEYLTGDITILNSDIVAEEKLISSIIIKKFTGAKVLLDSSIKQEGDYNVQVKDDIVVVMSKELKNYYGEYAGITKLDSSSAKILRKEVEFMVNEQNYNQWYENALVQLIFKNDFKLGFIDIAEYNWAEIDSVDDLISAKEIFSKKS